MSVEIIAEAAQGYEGTPKLAELLAIGAIRSGADSVKYQLVLADELAVPTYEYYGLFKSLEMDQSVWQHVVELIKGAQKKVYFDIYGDLSLALAKQLGASGVKISTTDFYNKPLVRKAIATFDKVFISIGGVPAEELDELVQSLGDQTHVSFMYGFQAEPTPVEENNLLRLKEFKQRYPRISLGFMDHSLGTSDEAFYLPLMAMSMGVSYIEKHITLDPLLKIEDYISALEPARFEKFVSIIRSMEPALGMSELNLTEKELKYKSIAGKVVVAKRDLISGTKLQEEDLVLKRVGTDGSPNCFRTIGELLEKVVTREVVTNSPITKDLI